MAAPASSVDVVGPGVRSATCTFTFWQGSRQAGYRLDIRQSRRSRPRERFFCLPVQPWPASSFLGDFNGIPCEPDVEQLPGSVQELVPRPGVGWHGQRRTTASSWYLLTPPLSTWEALIPGGYVEHLDSGSPVVMSWALNNHWFVNFKAQQDGQIRLRYSLTSMPGHLDVDKGDAVLGRSQDAASGIAGPRPFSPPKGEVGRVLEGADLVVGSKVSEDGTGIVLRLLNFKRDDQRVTVDMGSTLRGAWTVLPDERERRRP